MKKAMMALLLAASVFVMAGCGNDEKVIDGNGQNSGSGTEQSQGSNQEEGKGNEAAGGKGYVFTYKDTAITVDGDAGPIVAALGEPASYYEAASCAFDGLDKIYSYSGFELHTYPSGEKDYVSAIVFQDDSVSTGEGVCVGDSADKVKEVYGQGTEESGMLVYEKDGMKLCFILDGDVVAIEYRSTVLDQ